MFISFSVPVEDRNKGLFRLDNFPEDLHNCYLIYSLQKNTWIQVLMFIYYK